MHTTNLTIAFIALTTAHPILNQRQTKYYGISLNLNEKPINEQPVYGRAPTELNKLATYSDVVSQIIFDAGYVKSCTDVVDLYADADRHDSAAVNVDANNVECQAYSDADGVIPLGPSFTNAQPALFAAAGEPLVQVNAVLCYVSGDAL